MSSRIRVVLFGLLITSLAACGGEGPDPTDTAELTRGQKDTIISQLPIAGSRGVGRALQAVENSQARARQHDTIR